MPSLYLVPYTIRIKDIINGKYIKPGDRNEWGADLLEVLSAYLGNDIPNLPFNPKEKNKKTIRLESYTREDRTLSGILKAGDYGIEADLLNVENDEPTYTRQMLDAELIPYFFMIKIPTNTSTGIAIFQRLGNRGFKDIFEKDFSSHFEGKFSGQYKIEINPLVPREIVKRYLENRIVKIRLIKHRFPKEVSDVDLTGIPEEEQGEAEFSLKAHRNRDLPKPLLDRFRNNVDKFLGEDDVSVGSLLEIKNFQDFQADNVKVEVRIGTKYRTIDLSNIDHLKFSEDVTDKVSTNPKTGHPEFSEIKISAEEFLTECAEAIWGEASNE